MKEIKPIKPAPIDKDILKMLELYNKAIRKAFSVPEKYLVGKRELLTSTMVGAKGYLE